MRKRTEKLRTRIDDNKKGEEILLIFLCGLHAKTKQASVYFFKNSKN